jgi:hypothetical protein
MNEIEINFLDWVTSAAAAVELGCANNTLRKSRSTGTLFGRPAPQFIKRGYHVFYKKPTLQKFNDQFHEQANTAQTQQVAS